MNGLEVFDVRFHVGWGGESNIHYNGMKISP